MAQINRKVGSAIREQRLKLGVSQEELAFRAEVHRAYIGQIERGEKNLGLVNLEKICRALGTKPSIILEAAKL